MQIRPTLCYVGEELEQTEPRPLWNLRVSCEMFSRACSDQCVVQLTPGFVLHFIDSSSTLRMTLEAILEEIVEVIITRHHDYFLHALSSDLDSDQVDLQPRRPSVHRFEHVQAGVIMISDDFFPKLYQTRLLRHSDARGSPCVLFQHMVWRAMCAGMQGREMHRPGWHRADTGMEWDQKRSQYTTRLRCEKPAELNSEAWPATLPHTNRCAHLL